MLLVNTVHILGSILVIGEEEEESQSSDSGEEDNTPLNEDDYFEAPPTVQCTDISFTDMNLSRPLLKVMASDNLCVHSYV